MKNKPFSVTAEVDRPREWCAPVSPDYSRKTGAYTGRIHSVQIDLGKDDHDHLISPDERLRLA